MRTTYLICSIVLAWSNTDKRPNGVLLVLIGASLLVALLMDGLDYYYKLCKRL